MRDEKRPEPRFELDISATMDDVAMKTRNLSVSGIQLVCPPDYVSKLAEDFMISLVRVKFTLPGGKQLETRCCVIYLTKYQDEHLLGLKFTQYMGDSLNVLHEFMHRRKAADAQARG